jgi:DNA polymerase III subunit delta'
VVVERDEILYPWLDAPLREALKLHAGTALLLHGSDGNGQFELALAVARAFLCESRSDATPAAPACGVCAGCRLFKARTHPDLMFLVPDSLRETLGWPQMAGEEAAAGGSAGKAKPSKEIRVDAAREVVAFAQSSSARGMGKVVVVHPAERMNGIAANALLKTLEEPAGQTRYVLSTHAIDALLPTVRSRCIAVPIGLAAQPLAMAWLEANGVSDAGQMLAATGGRPLEVLAWAQAGIDAALWRSLPQRVAQGRAETFTDWPLPRVIETLQKLCHDSLSVAFGSAPRYFARQSLSVSGSARQLIEWSANLREHARHAEHPWQASLKIESVVDQARRAIVGAPPGTAAAQPGQAPRASLHSAQ